MKTQKKTLDQFSVYITKGRMKERIVERLIMLGDRQKRSLSWLCVDAIAEYLERHETG